MYVKLRVYSKNYTLVSVEKSFAGIKHIFYWPDKSLNVILLFALSGKSSLTTNINDCYICSYYLCVIMKFV